MIKHLGLKFPFDCLQMTLSYSIGITTLQGAFNLQANLNAHLNWAQFFSKIKFNTDKSKIMHRGLKTCIRHSSRRTAGGVLPLHKTKDIRELEK